MTYSFLNREWKVVIIVSIITCHNLCSSSSSTPGPSITSTTLTLPFDPPTVTCAGLPADFCKNGGICRAPTDDELWECSGDAGSGPLKCDCQPNFTGSRCESKLSCTELSCLSTEVCDYNWSKQKLECVLKNTSGSVPECKPGIHEVEFQFDAKNLQKQIVCLDMYNFNADSLCSDQDDSLTYLISQGPSELPYLFCLVVDYQKYQTCLRVNATHRNSVTMAQTQIVLEAEEYSVLERRAQLQLKIIFNKPIVVTNDVIQWFVNTADVMALDVIDQSGTTSSNQLMVSDIGLSSDAVVSASVVNNKLQLSLKSPVPSLNVERLLAEVKIKDNGVPTLSSNVTVQITLLRLVCQPIPLAMVDVSKLVLGTVLMIGQINCQKTNEYLLKYDLPLSFSPGLSLTIDQDNKLLLSVVQNNPVTPVTENTNVIVSFNQYSSIRETVQLNFEFYHYSLIWFERSSTTGITKRSTTILQILTDIINVINNAGVIPEVIGFRNNFVDLILKSKSKSFLQTATTDLMTELNKGKLGSTIITPRTVQLVNQVSYIFDPVVQLNGAVTAFNVGDTVSVSCEADFINKNQNPELQWKLDGILIEPLPTSRIQFTSSFTSNWKIKSTIMIDQIMLHEAGKLECEVRDFNGYMSFNGVDIILISLPVVSVIPTVFIPKDTEITLTCNVDSTGGATTALKWLQGTVEVNTGSTFRVSPSSDIEYSCIGTNSLGQSKPSIVKIVVIQDTITCPTQTDSSNTAWLKTPPGSTSVQNCPDTYTGMVSRQCNEFGDWLEPDYSLCTLLSLVDLQQTILKLESGIKVANPDKVVANLTTIAKDSVLTQSDVVAVTQAIQDLTTIIQLSTTNTSTAASQQNVIKFATEAVNLVGNLIDPKQNLSDVQKENTSVALLLLNTMDDVSKLYANTLPDGQTVTLNTDNIVLTVGKPSLFDTNNVAYPGNRSNKSVVSSSVYLPSDIFTTTTDFETVTYSIINYINLTSFPLEVNQNLTNTSSRSSVPFQINSDILSVNIFAAQNGFIAENLTSNITFTFLHSNASFDTSVCSYWDVDISSWDGRGCSVVSTNQTQTSCSCSHLTNFALLMKPTSITLQDAEILSVITLVGCSISIFCLLFTVLTYAFVWRYVRSDRAILLINLCVALIIALLLFLFGVDKTGNQDICTVIAVCLHYFYLVVFFLMLAEGIEVLVTIVKVFSSRSKLRELLIMSWGVPVIIVSITLGVTQLEGYGNLKFCWLSIDSGVIWAFVGPALFILLVNLIIVIKITYSLLNTQVMINKAARIKAKAALRSICVLLPVMGVAWIFGVLAVNEDLVIFDYIFTILNTLQGLFIFIFHCIINRKVREGLGHRRRRYRSRHTDLSAPQGTGSKFDRSRLSRKRTYSDDRNDGAGAALRHDIGQSNKGYYGDSHYLDDYPRKRPVERLRYPSQFDHQPGNYLNHFPEVSEGYSNLSVSEDPGPIYPQQNMADVDLNKELFRPAMMRGNSVLSGGFSDKSGSLSSEEYKVFKGLPRPKVFSSGSKPFGL